MTNEEILNERVQAYNKRQGPRVGDYIKLPFGIYARFTHKFPESIQTGGHEYSSFYFGPSGVMSYSGGLNPGLKLKDIRLTDEKKEGNIWFFDKNRARAYGGVTFSIPFRVFEPLEGADLSGCTEIRDYERTQLTNKLNNI